MQPALYRKIRKNLENYHLKTITLDIFDTVLLHEYWPASLRQYDVAAKWLPTVQELISPKITTYELASFADFAYAQLLKFSQTPRIDRWLDILLEILCLKYNITLEDEQHLQLLATLISGMIEFESNNAKPNRALIETIATLKSEFPELKVYFIADTYFTAEQINTILDIFEIKIFDGGVCSSELGAGKQDGKIFDLLSTELPEIDLLANLHIGDHRVPDYLMPILHDSQAIHYRPVRMRGLRTLVGKAYLRTLKFSAERREQKRARDDHAPKGNPIGENCYKYGVLAAQCYTMWGWQALVASELRSQDLFLIAGTNADKIAKRVPKLAERENVKVAKVLNITDLLKAFCWLFATYRTPRWDISRMLQILFYEAGLKNRHDLYKIGFTPNYAYSALATESLTDDAFWQVFLDEVSDNMSQQTAPLQEAYERTVCLLPQDYRTIHFIGLSDDGSARLFHEFCRLHGLPNEFRTEFLDSKVNLAKCGNQISQKLSPRRRQKIQRGNHDAASLLTDTELAPDAYVEKVIRAKLRRVCKTLN